MSELFIFIDNKYLCSISDKELTIKQMSLPIGYIEQLGPFVARSEPDMASGEFSLILDKKRMKLLTREVPIFREGFSFGGPEVAAYKDFEKSELVHKFNSCMTIRANFLSPSFGDGWYKDESGWGEIEIMFLGYAGIMLPDDSMDCEP